MPKTENLEKEILDRLRFLRDETDKIVIFLGQLAVQKRTINKKLKEISDNQEKYMYLSFIAPYFS